MNERNLDQIQSDYSRLPQELKQLKQWCVAGSDKSPYVASGDNLRRVSVHETDALHTFEEACQIAANFNVALGFILTANDGLTCIDLDVKDSTSLDRDGKPLPPSAWSTQADLDRFKGIIDFYQTYAELSKSGKGAHLWLHGGIGKGARRDSVEVYSQERFIICTGNSFSSMQFNLDPQINTVTTQILNPEPLPLKPNMQDNVSAMAEQMRGVKAATTELVDVEEELGDKQLVDKAMAAENGDKFNSLCIGDWQAMEYPSQSEADLALMSIFTFYSESNEQCRRLFRMSRLGKREKARRNDRYLDHGLRKIRGRQKQEEAERQHRIINGSQQAEALLENLNNDPFECVDIDFPPGLAGAMCEFMVLKARRRLPGLYPISALHTMALIGRKRKFELINKPNLITIAMALTAAGKELPQETAKIFAKHLGCSNMIHGNIASSKDAILNLVEGDGASLYIVDEYHSLNKSMNSRNAASYEMKIESEILIMNTTELYTFRGIDIRGLIPAYEADLEKLEEDIQKLEGSNDISRLAVLREKSSRKKRAIDYLENGWPDPFFSLMAHSVPSRLEGVISAENIDSGFLGRALIIRCPDTRGKLVKKFPDEATLHRMESEIVERLEKIQTSDVMVEPDEEGLAMLGKYVDWFDEDERRNHPDLGGIYARAPEQLYKIASLLALEDGVITAEFARYAYSLVNQSIQDIRYMLLKALADGNAASKEDVLEHARQQILKNCKGGGCTLSKIMTLITKPKGWNKVQLANSTMNLGEQLLDSMCEEDVLKYVVKGKKRRYITV